MCASVVGSGLSSIDSGGPGSRNQGTSQAAGSMRGMSDYELVSKKALLRNARAFVCVKSGGRESVKREPAAWVRDASM